MLAYLADNKVALLIGMASSLLTSLIFLYIMYSLRPSIRISDDIAWFKENEVTRYMIKVINTSLFPIYNLSIRTFLVTEVHTPNGKNSVMDPIVMKTPEIWVLRGFRVRHLFQRASSHKMLKKQTDYAVVFGCFDPTMDKWKPNKNTVRVEIFARHSFSGFSRVIKKDYNSPEFHLKEGKFLSGNTCHINH